MDDPRSKIVPGAAPPRAATPPVSARQSTRRTVHSPAPHARPSSAPGTAAVLRGTEPRALRPEAYSPLPPPPLPPGQRPEAVLLERGQAPGAEADADAGSALGPNVEATVDAEAAAQALEASLGAGALNTPGPPEPTEADEPTHDLPPPPAALRVALNRPISLADVRAVRSEQSAIASESTYVGPPD